MKAIKKKDQSDYIVKIVIIGDSGVGKTNILVRFCDNDFKISYSATIGVDFKIKVLNIDGCKIKLQIWDTAGQERYKNINQTYYRGAIGIILVYSITDQNSFENVENWIKQIHEHASSDVIKFLVGNKSDLRNQRKVEPEQAQKLASKYDMTFMEVSAKDGSNIEEVFQELGKKVHANINHNVAKDEGRFSVTKQQHENTGNNSSGCSC